MDPPSTLQFISLGQLGKPLKQVQESMIQGVCEKMKAYECHLKLCEDLNMNLLLDIPLCIRKIRILIPRENGALYAGQMPEEPLRPNRPFE